MENVFVGMKIDRDGKELTVLEVLERKVTEWVPVSGNVQYSYTWRVRTEDGVKVI